jgi:hypothetical protein
MGDLVGALDKDMGILKNNSWNFNGHMNGNITCN